MHGSEFRFDIDAAQMLITSQEAQLLQTYPCYVKATASSYQSEDWHGLDVDLCDHRYDRDFGIRGVFRRIFLPIDEAAS